MALKIEWSNEAEATYLQVLDYLSANWTDREVANFVKRTQQLLNNIALNPYIFKASKSKRVRKAVIGKQNSLVPGNENAYLFTYLLG
ncbi:type II toxin-antitoxin system RelE/ParE family toxin [Mucilaginibacter mali]|uniref:Type II toxin-antitoxin system RelE/ParE family toxin n=1 Tax=Mucilaginibacter mali TaxID=2740462 RepID=A0A7D4Q3Q2_9SPHI|nr:type II toxin-antitoxin system RelE/ParE family toxin [Mucilaginibacter mali]QKJ32366.1 type II toxin-antitoxin system RelE/ParE family toxin [Mucilaginibacter mali]